MRFIAEYLTGNPLIAIFLCLGIGYLLGKIKIGSFSFGATASTLIVAMVLCLIVGKYSTFSIDSNLRTVFFAMFTFVLGFDVGPAFFKALKSSGIKIVILAVVYAVVTCGFVWLTGKLLGYDSATTVGLFAGAFTQSAILGNNPESSMMLAYTMTYFIGTIGSIIFARYLLPFMLRVDLLKETKKKAVGSSSDAHEDSENTGIVQIRAFSITEGSKFIGQTVEAIENAVKSAAEVEMLYRGGEKAEADGNTLLMENDVITVVGDISALNMLDEHGLCEVADPKYFNIKSCDAEIVLTNEDDGEIYGILDSQGILIKEAEIGGKRKKSFKSQDLKKGDILRVHGPEKAVKQATSRLGYLKDNGITTDIPFLSFALMIGLAIGSISFMIMGKKIGLGASFGALVIGLIAGWLYDKQPKYGHIAESTRWFIKSIGLNLYIAVLGLTSSLTLAELLSVKNLIMMAVGLGLALVARIPIMYFAKYVLKLDTVDTVGGMCGAGTNTPALNSVTEYTGSSLYTLSFAPGYAVGNVVLIIAGLVLGYLI